MRSRFVLVTLLLIFGACKMKTGENPADLRQHLETSFQQHLYSKKTLDSTKVKYDILNVDYFDDSIHNKYICEFKVHMHINQNNFDTTGIMKAEISKDFQTITRLY